MSSAQTDRNLLFGVLALQSDLIDPKQFAEACAAWAAAKDQSLSVVMMSRGWITDKDRQLIEELLERKLARHGGDVHASLIAATRGEQRIAASLACARDGVSDPEIVATLGGAIGQKSFSLISTLAPPQESRDRYSLTTLHAKGGIGQVWVARDESLEREVALKELRPERASNPALVARFLREAVITGRLDHPGVVPVYELSRAKLADGLEHPFYTMRFIRGQTLSEAIAGYHIRLAEKKATRTQLIKLIQAFLGVCNTVAYAHDRGIIHRDLKGMNIILGDFGEVVLLDWGLAKSVDQPDSSDDALAEADPNATVQWIDPKGSSEGLTMAGEVLGTPAYMAPEQAAGHLEAVGKPTDVYGLGAILYDILAGRAPFDGQSTQEVLRKVREEMPTPPSKVSKSAPKALSAICMKSMAKAPKDRYASVTDLAADVQHWIADEPVTAYREPWSESLRRWAVKYRSQSIGAVAGLLFAAVALATMLYMQTRHNHELQQALDSERLALTEASDQSRQAENAIERFYTGVTEDVMLRRPELTGLRAKLLQAALQFYLQRVQMLQEGWRGKRILDIEIENVAYGLGRIAAIQALLGDRQAAIESRKKQITIYESQPRQSSSRIPTAWNDLANLQRLAGKPKDALQSYRAALKAAKERMGGPSLALLQADMGRFLVDLGHTAEGQSLLEEALSTQRELTRKPSRENAYIQGNLAASAMTLGNMADGQNDWKQAEEYYRESVESLQKLRELLPRDKWTMAELARALNNLGLGQANLARDAEVGRAAVMEGLKIREEFYHDQPLNIEYRADLARSYYHLARIEAIKGDRDAALAAITKAQELYKDIPPKGPEDLFFQACLKAMRAQYVSTSESATLSDDAMMLLRRGIEQGYSNVSRLKNDSALESLRARPDFQGLIDLANQVSAGTE